MRGLVKAVLFDFRGANYDFNKAIEINPEDDKAYYQRGNAKSDCAPAVQAFGVAVTDEVA